MRAVIFDWDLTLWNSWDIHLWLMEQTAAALGMAPPGPGAIAAEFHRPFHRHLLWFFGSAPDAESELGSILDAYLANYDHIVGHGNYLYPGVATLLRSLRRQGLRIGILSDKITRFGESELEKSGLADFVDFASFKTDSRPFKPDPLGLWQVLEGLDADPGDAMYVGDAPQDIRCARAAGTISAAAMWATIDADAILAQNPEYRLHRPHQVMAVVADANGLTGTNPWFRHLPWPWRPDADNPADDQDAARAGPAEDVAAEGPAANGTATETGPNWRYWPMSAHWRGRSGELALPPHAANPVAPLSLNSPARPPDRA